MKRETEFTCIVCPNGCSLRVEWEEPEEGADKYRNWPDSAAAGAGFSVSGNRCKRGEAFAESEMTAPKRTVCSTVRTVYPGVPALPVRLSAEIPKERIFDVMAEIRRVCVTKIVGRGDVIIPDVCGLGVDVIATSSVLKEERGNEHKTI